MKKLNIIYLSHSPHETHYKVFFNSVKPFSKYINLWVVYSKSTDDETDYEKTYQELYDEKIFFKNEDLIRNAKVYSIVEELNKDEFVLVVDADDSVNNEALENIINSGYLDAEEDLLIFNASKRFDPNNNTFKYINPSLTSVDKIVFKSKVLVDSKNLYIESLDKFNLLKDNLFYKPLHMSEVYFNLFILCVANSFLELSLSPYLYKEHSLKFINENEIEKKYRERKLSLVKSSYMWHNQQIVINHLNLIKNLVNELFSKEIWIDSQEYKLMILNEIKRISSNENIPIEKDLKLKIKEKPSIVICSDFKNDFDGAIALIKSIKLNTNINNIEILTITKTIEQTNQILELANRLQLKIKIHYIEKELDYLEKILNNSGKLEELAHITKIGFARMLIPKVLNKEKEYIYMDTDTLFVSKFNYNKTKFKRMFKPISVIKNGNVSPYSSKYWYDNYQGIYKSQKEAKHKAFNSGIIFFNKRSNKTNNFLIKAFEETLENNSFDYLDQAHLNYSLKGKVSYLNLKYNLPHYHIDKKRVKKIKTPVIIHFTSKDKPWNKHIKRDSQWTKKWKEIFNS